MLALSINVGDYVVLQTSDGLVKVQVVEGNVSGKYRLAIEAPQSIGIVRGSLWEEQHEGITFKKYEPKFKK
ncbi:carbon storage regulator [Clostridium algidicarnis]|uniref:Carbon storage regulator n=1 Tax=Clostridium algidicarnis TaxID=37659 RepID=A0ABS6C581_9CLOT|nr:carbon storage regulator [Clostridium algidicarnis]MBU3220650.1 carbon storage regulator [Clostridium algidicarnis]